MLSSTQYLVATAPLMVRRSQLRIARGAGSSLIRSHIERRKMATTKEMLALESKLIDYARLGRGRCRPLGNPDRPCSRDRLNEGQ